MNLNLLIKSFRSTLSKNVGAVILAQLGSYVVPLLSFPYLTRVLGVHKFGDLALALAVMAYFVLITEWGFGIHATGEVAKSDNDVVRSQIFWNTLNAKLWLLVLSLAVLTIALISVPFFYQIREVMVWSSGLMIGNALNVNWYLQGRNKVGAYSLISLAVRAIALIPIFLFVNKPSDVWIAAGIQSLSAVFVSVLSLVFVLSLREVQKVKISINETVRHLRESLPLFLSSAAVNLYTSSNTVILGAVSGPQEVGYFAAADRVRSAVQGLVGAVQQAIYPVAAKLFSQSLRRALLFIGNAMRYMFSLTMILGLLLALSAGFIIETLAGEGFSGARIPFCVLAFTPAVGVLNNFLGVQIIIPLGYRKYFSSVLIMVGAINVAVCAFVSSRLGASGAAVAALNAEVMILIAFLFKLKMSGISVNISGRIKEASYHE